MKQRICPTYLPAVLAGMMLSFALTPPVRAQDSEPIDGRLKIVGQGIERLILVDGNRKQHEFKPPADVISLPPGKYRPEWVYLKGGFKCYTYSDMSHLCFEIAPNSTTELKMGAPLTQEIRVDRTGKLLQLGYQLRGIGGEEYKKQDRSNPPEFAVYKGDKKVGGDKFEFG